MGGGSRAEDSHAEPRRRGGVGQLGAMVMRLACERDGDGLATENTKETKGNVSFQVESAPAMATPLQYSPSLCVL